MKYCNCYVKIDDRILKALKIEKHIFFEGMYEITFDNTENYLGKTVTSIITSNFAVMTTDKSYLQREDKVWLENEQEETDKLPIYTGYFLKLTERISFNNTEFDYIKKVMEYPFEFIKSLKLEDIRDTYKQKNNRKSPGISYFLKVIESKWDNRETDRIVEKIQEQEVCSICNGSGLVWDEKVEGFIKCEHKA